MNAGIKRTKLYDKLNIRKITFIFFDILAFSLALPVAFSIKFEDTSPSHLNSNILLLLILFIFVKLLVFNKFKIYDISWRFISIQDLANVSKAVFLSTALLFLIIFGINLKLFEGFPKSVLWIDAVLTFLISSGIKFSKRIYLEVMRPSIGNADLKRTLIVGAGSGGEQLLRDLNRSETRKINIIGFIDDDSNKQKIYIQGIRVLGTTENLSEIIKTNKIECILISVLSADRYFHRKIFKIARDAGVNDVKVISSINDVSDTVKIGVKDIRDINLSDLIGRQAVSINTKIIGNFLNGKNILITGAAGSIGSEIACQVASYNPANIAVLDINESDLSDLEIKLNREFGNCNIKMYLCDISLNEKVNKIFKEFRPDVIFHAAAFKHVPVMEKFPEEAVRVNILGTYNLAVAADYYGAESFVLISTDKAVNPTGIMGASKRVAEYIVTGMGKKSNSNFVAVRFGNVIGSRGSVLPIFMEQLKNGGPITVTHPDMQRYFMMIPEAVALVLQAAATGRNGDVFLLDMGEPIKIVDLVKDLIQLHNLVPEKDIKIKYTGIREGEKLFEEILTAEEGVSATSHEKIFRSKISCMYDMNAIQKMVEEFVSMDVKHSKKEWSAIFKYYVPTFTPAPGNENIQHEQEGKGSVYSSSKEVENEIG